MSAEPARPGPEFSRRYRLIEKLGADHSGEVYRAEPTAGGDPVRARLVSARLEVRDAAQLLSDGERFQGVDHPNLLPLIDLGGIDELPFLVYPHVDAVGLDRLLEKHGRLAPAAALRIARGVAQAVAEIHAAGLVHGFITPAAVLMERTGNARLADGGMARLRGAPTAADDLRAVGDLLFQMLAGRLPARGTPPRLDRVLDGVPGPLVELVERASVSAARGGYARAEELVERLEVMVADPILGVRKEAFPDLGAGAEPAPTVRQAAVGAPVPLDLSAAGVSAGPPPAPEPDPAGGPEAEPESGSLPAPPPLRPALAIPSVRAVAAQSAPKAPASIKLELAPRGGPTMGQLVLILLAGFGAIGGLVYLNSQEKTFGSGSVAKGIGDGPGPGTRPPGPTRRPTGPVGAPPDDLDELARAIVTEPDVVRRAELTQVLLKKHEVQAPQVLSRILAGGGDKLRLDLFPVLESVDKDGLIRLGLLGDVTQQAGPWVVALAASLSASGKTAELARIGTKPGSGALLALAGSTRNRTEIPLEAALRFEEAFFKEVPEEGRKLVEGWMRASGPGAVSVWVASTLLARARTSDERQALLEAITGAPPSPPVFAALQATAEKLAFGWEADDHAYLETALDAQAGADPVRLAEIPKIMAKVSAR